TLAEIVRERNESTPSSPSEIVKDLDPAVERVILRCVERDPQQRPASVLGVAAALPGGDPLAAALAAGETPSPQLVADARAAGGLARGGGGGAPAPGAAPPARAGGGAPGAGVPLLFARGGGWGAPALLSREGGGGRARETMEPRAPPPPPADTAQGFAYDDDL